jgi:hypothetical protein
VPTPGRWRNGSNTADAEADDRPKPIGGRTFVTDPDAGRQDRPESGQHKHRSRHPVQDKASGQLD